MKIRILSHIMLIIMMGIVFICPQEVLISAKSKNDEGISVVDKVMKENEKYLNIDIIIPVVSGLKDKAKEDIINNKIEKWTNDWLQDIRTIADDYYKGSPTPEFPFEAFTRYQVKNNNNKILSLYIEYYQFTGGAHGITTRIPYNIDVNTGNMVGINDLFKSTYNYKEVIDKEIRRQIAQEPDKYFDNGAVFKGIKDNDSFYIEGDKLVMFYGQYELAPYVAGIIEFRIPVELLAANYLYAKI